jgi:O-antigen ligase
VSGLPIDALKYGLIGLGFLLALLSFILLQSEQRRNPPRQLIFRQIYLFMAFSLCMMAFGLFS